MAYKGLIAIFMCLPLAACSDSPRESTDIAPEYATPYAVGSVTLFIHDESRPFDSVAGVDAGIRTMITEIWYPVDHAIAESGQYRRATYGDYVFGDIDVHRMMMTSTTFFHLTPDTVREGISDEQIASEVDALFFRERGSLVEAPIADIGQTMPVIVMSHGDAGSRYNMETVVEHLAAHGYLVIAPEHTGNSPYSQTGRDPAFASNAAFSEAMAPILELLSEYGTYGDAASYGQSYAPSSSGVEPAVFLQTLDASLLQRLNDLRAIVRWLEDANKTGFGGREAGFMNLARIGLTGRSFGGLGTLTALEMENRFTAGFAVVPPGIPDPRPALSREQLVEDRESVLLSAEGDFPPTALNKPTLILSGAEDSLIIAGAASRAEASGIPAPTPDNPHPLLRGAFEKSEAPVVWAMLSDSNHATLGVSGSFWWPELKQQTAPRYFNPDESFELTDVAEAHRMQKALALAFFDFTIRRDASAAELLKQNPYGASGLQLETRNF